MLLLRCWLRLMGSVLENLFLKWVDCLCILILCSFLVLWWWFWLELLGWFGCCLIVCGCRWRRLSGVCVIWYGLMCWWICLIGSRCEVCLSVCLFMGEGCFLFWIWMILSRLMISIVMWLEMWFCRLLLSVCGCYVVLEIRLFVCWWMSLLYCWIWGLMRRVCGFILLRCRRCLFSLLCMMGIGFSCIFVLVWFWFLSMCVIWVRWCVVLMLLCGMLSSWVRIVFRFLCWRLVKCFDFDRCWNMICKGCFYLMVSCCWFISCSMMFSVGFEGLRCLCVGVIWYVDGFCWWSLYWLLRSLGWLLIWVWLCWLFCGVIWMFGKCKVLIVCLLLWIFFGSNVVSCSIVSGFYSSWRYCCLCYWKLSLSW